MKTGSEFHVGIVGLGSMGMGAALSCVRAGLSTWGADLNSNACATLKEAGACGVSDNAATFAEKLDALLVLVVNAAQVKQVLFGETGVAQHLKPGTAVMVSSTIASADAQEIATALAGFDLEMLDAPVSGGAVKAANGEMTVMASGSDIAFERLAPVLEAVAGKVYRIGNRADITFSRTVESRAVFEIDLFATLLLQPAQSRQRLLCGFNHRTGTRFQADHQCVDCFRHFTCWNTVNLYRW
jgi:L-threonate 2-dehydrogenase